LNAYCARPFGEEHVCLSVGLNLVPPHLFGSDWLAQADCWDGSDLPNICFASLGLVEAQRLKLGPDMGSTG
jgi:hypothetical protein